MTAVRGKKMMGKGRKRQNFTRRNIGRLEVDQRSCHILSCSQYAEQGRSRLRRYKRTLFGESWVDIGERVDDSGVNGRVGGTELSHRVANVSTILTSSQVRGRIRTATKPRTPVCRLTKVSTWPIHHTPKISLPQIHTVWKMT